MMSHPQPVTVRTRAVTITSSVVVLTLLIGGTITTTSAETPAEKCARSKIKAAEKKTSSKLRCYQKALQKGVGFDIPLCLVAAEARLLLAFAQAEQRGGCNPMAADAASIETKVDDFVADIVNNLPAEGTPVATPTATCPGPCPTSTPQPTVTCPAGPGTPCPMSTPTETQTPTPMPSQSPNTRSLDLTTSGQYLSAPDSPWLSITGRLTIECWVKFTTQPCDGCSIDLVSKWESSGAQFSYALEYGNTSGFKQIAFDSSQDGNISHRAAVDVNFGIGFTTNVWYHVAVVYSPSGAEFFVNGVSIGSSGSTVGSIFNSTAFFRIGASNSPPERFLNGRIDEVRVWDIARTPAEIADNYQRELVGSELQDPNLKGHWKFNGCSLADLSLFGNTLSFNGPGTLTCSTDVPFP